MSGTATIERVETIPYALRFREPYVTARGRLERRELVLLRLRADGVEGLGEAAPLSLRGGPGARELETELADRCGPLLEGAELDSTDVDSLLDRCASAGLSLGARAALELALLDLAGKLRGEPVWRLLGAAEARAVPCNATLAAADPPTLAASAERWAQRGFATLKLKVGMDGDADQVRAVRAALPDATIRIDANGAWATGQAVSKLRELAPCRLELAEQPAASLEALESVRRQVDLPIAADESVVTLADARAAAAAGCDAATVKLAKVGGVAAAIAIAAELPVYLSSALDGPVGIAGAAHAAQALPRQGFAAGLAHGLATAALFEGTIASSQCELSGSRLLVATSPGLGVELDEAELSRHRL